MSEATAGYRLRVSVDSFIHSSLSLINGETRVYCSTASQLKVPGSNPSRHHQTPVRTFMHPNVGTKV